MRRPLFKDLDAQRHFLQQAVEPGIIGLFATACWPIIVSYHNPFQGNNMSVLDYRQMVPYRTLLPPLRNEGERVSNHSNLTGRRLRRRPRVLEAAKRWVRPPHPGTRGAKTASRSQDKKGILSHNEVIIALRPLPLALPGRLELNA